MKTFWKYITPLVIFITIIVAIWLISEWTQNGLSAQQKILLLGSVILGVSTAVAGYQAMKSLTDEWFGNHSNRLNNSSEGNVSGQFDKIRAWLIELPDAIFRNTLRGFLTKEEQTLLRGGIELVDRGSALGTILELNKLNEFEDYLKKTYPDYIRDR